MSSTVDLISGGGVTLPAGDRDRLRDVVSQLGEAAAIRRLELSRATLARCLGGMTIRRGTVIQVQAALAALAQSTVPRPPVAEVAAGGSR